MSSRRMRDLSDFGALERTDLESNEELEAVAWAENNGWLVRKMQFIGRRGCPDRFFFGFGQTVQIEMKRASGRLSPEQKQHVKDMAGVGITVHVCYSASSAIDTLQRYMQFHVKGANQGETNGTATDLTSDLGL